MRRPEVKVVAVAIQCAVRHEVVQVSVVLQRSAVRDAGRVVHESAEELEGFRLREPSGVNAVGELHLEGLGLLVQPADRAFQIRLDQRKGGARREPVTDSRSRVTPEAAQPTTRRRV